MCSAEPRQPLMKFEWRTHGGVQPGPELTISLGEEHDDDVHSCSVSNPLSNETATFTAKDCYTGKDALTLRRQLYCIFIVHVVKFAVACKCTLCFLHISVIIIREQIKILFKKKFK